MMEGIGRARASAQRVVSKPVESRLCELRPTIGGGDMMELLAFGYRLGGSWVSGKLTLNCVISVCIYDICPAWTFLSAGNINY